jgi:hypothetical protein
MRRGTTWDSRIQAKDVGLMGELVGDVIVEIETASEFKWGDGAHIIVPLMIEFNTKVVAEKIGVVTWFKTGTQSIRAHNVGSRFDDWVSINTMEAEFN